MDQAIVVGTGPNGLAAAVTLAGAGLSVTAYEANQTIGGGSRSAELTRPGFIHDICSAVHPMGCASPYFRSLPLSSYGLQWIHPLSPLAHPLDDGSAVMLERSMLDTARGLGRDAGSYYRLMRPFLQRRTELLPMLLRPPLRMPRHPLLLARFGIPALLPAAWLASLYFGQPRSRALFGGIAAHSMLPLGSFLSASFGLVLGMTAHAVGWPVSRGGSQKIADALAAHLRSLGGRIITGKRIESIDGFPAGQPLLLDVTPRQLLGIAGHRLPPRYRNRMRQYRYGPGIFKLDYALDGPVPWTARECLRAATVHLGGEISEIIHSEDAVARGEIPDRPFIIAVQPSLFDSTRAPEGRHTLWAYCHVPNGSAADMTARIEAQIERFAPGFADRILARHSMGPSAMEAHNANYVGGDINGGIFDIRQFLARPAFQMNPYRTPVRGLYLCSASTPPGGGVHGMCGYHAAISALRDIVSAALGSSHTCLLTMD